jgi:hypothetical protein
MNFEIIKKYKNKKKSPVLLIFYENMKFHENKQMVTRHAIPNSVLKNLKVFSFLYT